MQQVQQIKAQHANFHAQPKPEQVPAVTFNQNYRIQGSDQWQGPQYEVFRSYHPERHDEGWYHSRYNRVELIGGGYYYLNNGYWYPAWGYNPSAEYYAYDAPIYVGHRAEPPDKVIADVQAELQQMGYYKGEVDGLLGPLTREALTGYQTDQGLTATAVIDEPTLDSLGMGRDKVSYRREAAGAHRCLGGFFCFGGAQNSRCEFFGVGSRGEFFLLAKPPDIPEHRVSYRAYPN